MVLIDVDGTLVDSVPDLAFCVDEMLKQLDMPVRGEAAVRHWVGNGVERLVKRGLINELNGEPDDVLYNRALPIFRELYAENTSVRSCLYDGVPEAMEFLKTTGVKIGCVTNKASEFTLPILKDLGISIPNEIGIAGFANEPFTELTDPGLTSVEQFSERMGQEAADLLIAEIEEKHQKIEPSTIKIKPELIIRQSTYEN